MEQFGLLGSAGGFNCLEISKLLYEAYLNAFKIEIQPATYEILLIFQHRVYDLIEDLRETDSDQLKLVLKALDEQNPTLADIIIMSWCLPRVNMHLSKIAYDNEYKDNISRYNHLLTSIADFYVIKNFCIETLSKKCSVPIHCIDIIWFHMGGVSVDFGFRGDMGRHYLEFKVDDSEYICIDIHMEFILVMGLGQSVLSDHKGPFSNFLKKFVTEPELIKALSESPTAKNYLIQLKRIVADPVKYFGEEIEVVQNM
jgi:hypothetical protein